MVLGNASSDRRVRRRSRRSGEESTSTRPVRWTMVSFPTRSTSILRLLLEGMAPRVTVTPLVLYDLSAILIHLHRCACMQPSTIMAASRQCMGISLFSNQEQLEHRRDRYGGWQDECFAPSFRRPGTAAS